MTGVRPLAGFLWALASLALAVGVWAGVRVAPGIAPFRLESVRVEGVHRTRPAAVLEAANLSTGVALFSLDVEEIRQAAERLPWVRRARVVRQVPSALTVTAEEWVPRYLVSLDRLYYLTAEGHVVKAPLDQGLDFPVVTGLTWGDLEGSGPLRDALLELFGELDRNFGDGELSEIHADATTGFTVYSAKSPGQGIYLGFGSVGEKFSRLSRLRRHLERHNQVARAVSLVYDDKIIARLAPAAGEGPEK